MNEREITITWHGKQIERITYLNPAQWSKTYLISIPMGFESSLFVVEGTDEGCAIDEFIDSPYYHLVEDDERNPDTGDYVEWISFGGNEGKPYNAERLEIECFELPENERLLNQIGDLWESYHSPTKIEVVVEIRVLDSLGDPMNHDGITKTVLETTDPTAAAILLTKLLEAAK